MFCFVSVFYFSIFSAVKNEQDTNIKKIVAGKKATATKRYIYVRCMAFLACGCRPMSVAKLRGANVDQLIRFDLSRSCENVLRMSEKGNSADSVVRGTWRGATFKE